VIVAVPTATAVTSPLDVTVATWALLVDHVTTRPLSASPALSRGSADSWVVCPTTISTLDGLTSIVATGTAETEIDATAERPSAVARMTAPPVASAVTMPSSVTVATLALLVVHVTGLPGSTFPALSSGSAVSWTDSPTSMPRLLDDSLIDATGVGVTVTSASASCPCTLAAILTVPTDTPVTSPPAVTSAIAGSSVAQRMPSPASMVPSAERASARSVKLAPTATVATDGATLTLETSEAGPGSSASLHATVSTTASAATRLTAGRDRATPR
jgi:hypothetical protein